MADCTHLGLAAEPELPAQIDGCEECLALGWRWLHLRMCTVCGHIGCCDNSPGRHATAHFHATGHPLMRSAEPGETWWWCFVDEVGFDVELAPEHGTDRH